MGGDSGGCAHDARSNGVPEGHGDTKTDAENSKQLGFWRCRHGSCSLIGFGVWLMSCLGNLPGCLAVPIPGFQTASLCYVVETSGLKARYWHSQAARQIT